MMTPPERLLLSIYCTAQSNSRLQLAQTLATQFNCSLIKDALSTPYQLIVTETYVGLQSTHLKLKPFYVDFNQDAFQTRIKQATVQTELLLKAIGFKKSQPPSVIDATLGLGTDAFLMASLGCTVIGLERAMVVNALLQDGLSRFCVLDRILPLTLIQTEACLYLNDLQTAEYPDVIYLDPMFPDRTKSASVKKEMRMLKALVGDDLDAADLLSIALLRAKQRVVVKRPKLAPALQATPQPDWVISGKVGRFDVYRSQKCAF